MAGSRGGGLSTWNGFEGDSRPRGYGLRSIVTPKNSLGLLAYVSPHDSISPSKVHEDLCRDVLAKKYIDQGA
jgi:hypothetical protein